MTIPSPIPDNLLPMTPAVFNILLSLADGEKHGYAMMEDIESTSGVRLGPGTLYGAISRLEGEGMIEALPADERRRPYRHSASAATAPHLSACAVGFGVCDRL